MSFIPEVKKLLRKILTPITIMLVPHTSRKTVTLKMPAVGLMISAVLSIIGAYYVYSVTVKAILYKETKEKLDYYSEQFTELKPTITALKMAESEFNRLFSLKSKKEVLENLNFMDRGAIDMEVLRQQLKNTISSVGEIKDYLNHQRDLYLATPVGWPVRKGWISSEYGNRIHPFKGRLDFHTGIDISTDVGTPVKATADGIVSFSGWSGNSGMIVVVEHGFGFKTFYAHNSKNLVKTGQVVKRGETVSLIGATGNATGPHLHYEIWKEERAVNPKKYMNEEG